jgi:hypothetical protein
MNHEGDQGNEFRTLGLWATDRAVLVELGYFCRGCKRLAALEFTMVDHALSKLMCGLNSGSQTNRAALSKKYRIEKAARSLPDKPFSLQSYQSSSPHSWNDCISSVKV